MDIEGIFRVSGSTADTKAMCDSFIAGRMTVFRNCLTKTEIPWENSTSLINPHNVSTALKLYFRERTLPIVPYKVYRAYIDRLLGIINHVTIL